MVDRADWLAARAAGHGIGASDAAVLLGVSPFADPFDLWAQRIAPHLYKQHTGSHLDDGTRWESVAVEVYRAHVAPLRVEVDAHKIAQHPALPWLRATPDARIFRGSLLDHLWECKTDRTPGAASVWPDDGTIIDDFGDELNGPVPPWYWIQCQIQAACTGVDRVVLEVWMPRSFAMPEVRRIHIFRDERRTARMIDRLAELRELHLVQGIPPEPTTDAHRRILARWRYPNPTEEREATEEEAQHIAQALIAATQRDAATEAYEHHRAACMAAMGGAKKVWTRFGYCTITKAGHPQIKGKNQ